MAIKATAQQTGGKTYDPIAPNNYPARVAQIIDLGVQTQRPYKGVDKPPARMLRVTYELVTEFLPDEDGNPDTSKPRWVSEDFPLFSLAADKAKSTLRYLALDPTNEGQGDWEQLIGKPCLVAVTQNVSKSNGKTYNNVASITMPIAGMPVPELVNPTKVFDLDNPDLEVFNSFPDWLKGKIQENLEYEGSPLAVALGDAPVGQAPEPEPQPEGTAEIDDDDVPF